MFTVIRGGCFSRHSSDFIMQRPNGLPYYLLLIIKTDSEITIAGKLQHCKPNSVLLIHPNTPYSYLNPNGNYIDDWIHFQCQPEDITPYEEIFHQGFSVGNARLLTTYLQQILLENQSAKAEEKEFYVDSLFRILLRHIHTDFHSCVTTEYTPYQYKLQKLRLELAAAPYKKYTAAESAEKLKISVSYFQALYKTLFGVPFQSDIINMRIDYAKELITCTGFPLEQIACSCGYNSEVHFYRQFLAKTGMTPGDYRKIYAN